jgi:RNA polymerase sigma-70 factor (ECF subfamily)
VLCPTPAREHGSDEHDSDAALVRDMIGGSGEAFECLYQRHRDALFDAAWRTTSDSWIATETVQDSFMALWTKPHLFDPSRGSLRGWLVTVARNRAVDRLRASRRSGRTQVASSYEREGGDDRSLMEALISSGTLVAAATAEPGPETAAVQREDSSLIADALSVLMPTELAVITLAYGGGMSQSEVADHLGWPLGTVKTRTRRALHKLRDRLGDDPRVAGPRIESATAGRPADRPRSRRLASASAVGARRNASGSPRL